MLAETFRNNIPVDSLIHNHALMRLLAEGQEPPGFLLAPTRCLLPLCKLLGRACRRSRARDSIQHRTAKFKQGL